jgi:hypothetical protein
MRYLVGDVCHYRGGGDWSGSVPSWLIDQVLPSRARVVLSEHHEKNASDSLCCSEEELVIQLFELSCCGPLSEQLSDGYQQIGPLVLGRHKSRAIVNISDPFLRGSDVSSSSSINANSNGITEAYLSANQSVLSLSRKIRRKVAQSVSSHGHAAARFKLLFRVE